MTISPFFRVTITGKENLPDDEACVYVANHQSFMDILSAYQLFKPFKFISKASILKFPLIGWVMRTATPFLFFPEGTRSSDGRLLPFKRGPVSMAKRAKVPIVPMTILGTGRIMPSKKEYLLYQNNAGVKIIVHPKVPVQEVEDTPATWAELRMTNTRTGRRS
ncbi:unnamed protein product [Durusdinium trenchii]|uniref:Phospholipid/glycerol acyltransferase domain-containing protein n=1 Tax=Durusdinium trenchii TaxID=1381693 RepID=A0ABP0P8G7_9DINO